MHKLFLVILPLSMIWSSTLGAIAQAKPRPPIDENCYFINSAGKVINLNRLCGANPVAPSGVYQVPIKRRLGGIPVIDVLFGNQKFEMMLDTGASGTIITSAMADRLGIVPVARTLVNTASANNVELPLGYVPRVEVNGLVMNNLLVGILPSLRIGLLGNDFYGQYDLTVRRNMVEFRNPNR